MRIAIVTETFLPSTDGIVTRLCATIRWLRENNHELLVIAPDLGVTEYWGAKVVGIKARRFFLYRDKKLALPSTKVGTLLKEFQPDLVHVVNPAVLGVAGVFYGRRYGLPLVASYHTKIPEYADYYKLPFLKPVLWWYLRLLHNRAELNLCTSVAVQNDLRDHGFRNVQLWSRGVDHHQFGPQHYDSKMREQLTGGRIEKTLLLYVGRLAAEKGIENIRNVLEASSDFCFAVVGDGPHRARLEAHFKGTDTVFTGFLHGQELAQAYASSDVFVFPSTTETLGLVLLEAMSSGLTVVAADSGPTREQVEDGVTGMLFQADLPGSLRDTVLKLKVEETRKRIGSRAYETSKQIGWSKPSEQLLEYYGQLLQQTEPVKGLS